MLDCTYLVVSGAENFYQLGFFGTDALNEKQRVVFTLFFKLILVTTSQIFPIEGQDLLNEQYT
jgi:hypothetical protein